MVLLKRILLPSIGELCSRHATLACNTMSTRSFLPSPTLQARGKLHKAALQFALEGSATDVIKAALASTAAALASLDAQAGSTGAQRTTGRAQMRQPEWPEVVLVLGHSLVVHLPGQYIAAAHGGDGGAAAATVAGAVQRALSHLRVGPARLAAPLAAAFTAGRTLYLLDQMPVAPAAAGQAGAAAQRTAS